MSEAKDMSLVTTRGVEDAPLPVHYEAAKRELAECARVDEAASWANKAAALASYARQSKDDTLEQMAMRIRARAIRRCGELLKEIPAKAGQGSGVGTAPHRSERDKAAKDAGLSTEQKHTALRVANVPAPEFELAVESDNPPTVSDLADRGTQKKAPLIDIMGRDPEDYNRSLLVNGAMNDLAGMVRSITPDELMGGCVPRHYPKMKESAARLSKWLTELLHLLESK